MEQEKAGTEVVSSEWYLRLVESSRVAIFGTGLDTRILSWNEGVRDLLGYEREEFVGQRAELILDDNKQMTAPGRHEGLVRRKNGESLIAEIVTSVMTGPDDSTIGFSHVIREVATSDSEELARLRAILDQLPCGFALAAPGNGALLSLNQEGVRLLRHPLRTVHQSSEYAKYGAIHPDGTPYLPEEYPIAQAVLGKIMIDQEMLYQRGDGTLTHLSVSASPVRDADGNLIAAACTFYDLSERKQAEAERDHLLREFQRSNEDLSHFAHTVSHDLQAPLRTMRSYGDLLMRRYGSVLDANAADFIRFIADGAERMDDLVQALLKYARAGGSQLNLETVRVDDIVDSVLTNLEHVIEETGAEIHCDPLPSLRADEVQLTQLFQNLIGNALRYCPKDRRPEVTISAARTGNRWIFTIADNGPGIPPAYHDRVFMPLKRLHGADIPGSGMGLAICRRIVHRHEGHIWLESNPGEGAKFHFTLPALPD